MKTFKTASRLVLGTLLVAASASALAQTILPDPNNMVASATVNSIQNVPSIDLPVSGAAGISSQGTRFGPQFNAFYSVQVKDLSSPVTKVHIHYGQNFVADGGLLVELCGGAKTPPCGQAGTGGTLKDGDTAMIPGIPAQGIRPGNLRQVLKAIRDGSAYVNVHTQAFPKGEARGQFALGQRVVTK